MTRRLTGCACPWGAYIKDNVCATREMTPSDKLISEGFCLARVPEHYVFYLPRGGKSQINLSDAAQQKLVARWFNPRSGEWHDGPILAKGKSMVTTPGDGDWLLYVRGRDQE